MANACLSGCFMRLQCSSHAIYKFVVEIEQVLCIPKPFIVLINYRSNCRQKQVRYRQLPAYADSQASDYIQYHNTKLISIEGALIALFLYRVENTQYFDIVTFRASCEKGSYLSI